MEYVRTRTIVITGLVLALVAVLAIVTLREVLRPGPGCTTALGDGAGTITVEQADSAATIAGVGMAMGMPDHAVTVALATAMQESGLRNLPGGDRDSAGLFQQRPSQGWGTPDQISDPRYASHRFYSALLKVKGWEAMRVTDAAQAVQRSAHPEAYEKWADKADGLARALIGDSTSAVSCTIDSEPSASAERGPAAADALAAGLRLDWGDQTHPQTTGDVPGLTVAVTDARAGWQYAHWLVAYAEQKGVKRVRFTDREWTAKGGSWTRVTANPEDGGRVIAEVYGDA
jgi:hypothetical protein